MAGLFAAPEPVASAIVMQPSYRTVTPLPRHLQGIGLALAVGLRPFLPALLAGALARGDVGVDFDGTDVRVPGVARRSCSR